MYHSAWVFHSNLVCLHIYLCVSVSACVCVCSRSLLLSLTHYTHCCELYLSSSSSLFSYGSKKLTRKAIAATDMHKYIRKNVCNENEANNNNNKRTKHEENYDEKWKIRKRRRNGTIRSTRCWIVSAQERKNIVYIVEFKVFYILYHVCHSYIFSEVLYEKK